MSSQDVSEEPDEDLPMFSTLILALGSLVAAAVVVWYALTTVRWTSSSLVRLTQREAANLIVYANRLINQAQTVVLQALPQIEHTATEAYSAVSRGVESTFNAISALGQSVFESTATQFSKLSEMIGDFAQQVTSLFLQTLEPTSFILQETIAVVERAFHEILQSFENISDIVTTIIDSIRSIFNL